MRKFLLTIIATALVAIGMQAGKGEVILTKQVLPHTSLPEKTDEWKFQNLRLDTTGHQFKMLRAIAPIIKQVTTDDYEYFVFGLEFTPGIGQTTITIKAFDPMSLTPANRKLMIEGVVKLPHDYLMILTSPASEELVSQITRKAGGNTKFVREFEMVSVPVVRHRTHIIAVWDGDKLTVTEMMINGDDKLHPAPPVAEPADTTATQQPTSTNILTQDD